MKITITTDVGVWLDSKRHGLASVVDTDKDTAKSLIERGLAADAKPPTKKKAKSNG